MKRKLIILIILNLLISSLEIAAQTNISGIITSNTTWTPSGNPYIVIGNTAVDQNITLTIEAGVNVKFNNGYYLYIEGRLIAEGTDSDYIHFTSNNSNPNEADWECIKFRELSNIEDNILNYCIIEYANDAVILDGSSLLISNTIIRNNTNGLVCYWSDANLEISNLIIKNNSNYGISGYVYNNFDIIGNIITNNGIGINKPLSTEIIKNNIIKDNTIGIFLETGGTNDTEKLENNLFINNSQAGIILDGYPLIIHTSFNNNTFIYNGIGINCNRVRGTISNNTLINNNYGISNIGDPSEVHIKFNNIHSNLTYNFENTYGNNIDATNNWWGNTSSSYIDSTIYDFYDNTNYGRVNYTPFLDNIHISAPISPPKNVTKSDMGNGNVQINWIPNSESDLEGYKIYFGYQNDYTYTYSIDAGNVTTYTLSGVNFDDTLVVTAYDNQIDGINDQFDGNESWYSQNAIDYFTTSLLTGSDYCEIQEIIYQVNVTNQFQQGNSFIFQLSADAYDFTNAVNLAVIDTTNTFDITIMPPDTLVLGEPYFIRVISTSPEAYSTIDSITIYETPTSDFILGGEYLCNSEPVLISYSGTATNAAIYDWDFNDGTIVSGSGMGPYELSWNTSGIKTIDLTVIENGCTSESTQKNVVVYWPDSEFLLDDVVCENQETLITFIGTASDSATFIWNFDGANIVSGTGAGPYTVYWNFLGTKEVSLIINDNGCTSPTTTKFVEHSPMPTATIYGDTEICFGDIAFIEYTGSGSSLANFNWDFDGGSIMSGFGSGPYEITWPSSGTKTVILEISENGCSSTTEFNLTINQQTLPIQICMVSVDSVNHNSILWESASISPYDSVIIYKEGAQANVYNKIGARSASNTSMFVDYSSNPAQQSSKYKIAVLDTCAYETALSNHHKTIHLTINKGLENTWNLLWDTYEGFYFSTFNIFRSANGEPSVKIAELANYSFSYSDLYPPLGTVYYYIEVIKPDPCFITNTKFSGSNYSTHSNIVNSAEASSISEDLFKRINIWPNPAGDVLYLNADDFVKAFTCSILGIDGQLLMTTKLNPQKTQINVSKLKKGIYFFKIEEADNVAFKKFIKQ